MSQGLQELWKLERQQDAADLELADATGHLVEACEGLERLLKLSPRVGGMPLELAARSFLSALVALDEVSTSLWEMEAAPRRALVEQWGPWESRPG